MTEDEKQPQHVPAQAKPRPHSGDLSVGETLRAELGLDAAESLRVLRTTPRTITLERSGGDHTSAVPWDRELVLTADVQAFALADVLSLLHGSGKSGFIAFLSEHVEKCIYLRRGEVIFATSNQPGDRLGENLMRGGRISLQALRDTEAHYAPPARFGKTLVERGALSPRELWEGVRHQVEDIVRSLFAYNTGVIHFWEGEVEPDNVVRLSLPTQRLIDEGLAGRDELLRFVAQLEDARVFLRRIPKMGDSLSGNGRAVYDYLAERDRFPDLCRRAGLDPLSTARTLQLLQVAGAMSFDVEEDEDALLVDPERKSLADDVLRERALDHVRLLAELVAPLVAIDGEKAVRLRLDQLLDEVAAAHPALLSGLEWAPGCVLDPKALSERALRLPGDRKSDLSAALGELTSYVEFELKNHPRIDEAERYLDAVEELRAKTQL